MDKAALMDKVALIITTIGLAAAALLFGYFVLGPAIIYIFELFLV